MPRTAHRVTADEPLRERPTVVRTVRPNREQLGARPSQHHLLVTHVPEHHAPVSQCGGLDPFGQIESRLLLLFTHDRLRATVARRARPMVLTPTIPSRVEDEAAVRVDNRPTPAQSSMIREDRLMMRSWNALLVLVVTVAAAPASAQRAVDPARVAPGHACTAI